MMTDLSYANGGHGAVESDTKVPLREMSNLQLELLDDLRTE